MTSTATQLDAVVEEIEQAGGDAVASLDTVATADGGRAIVAKAVEQYGTVDILVNNAGNLRAGDFAGMSLDDFEAVLAVHLNGAFCVTQPAWTIMRGRGRGRIVMTSSAGGVYPEEGYSEYATAKAGIIGLTRALAAEGKEHGIFVERDPAASRGLIDDLDRRAHPQPQGCKFSGPTQASLPTSRSRP